MVQTISIVVKGKVQGVYFRQSAKEMAQQLGITGEVRNAYDGSVQIIATGHKDALQSFIDWCRKGPPRASVDEVHTTHQELQQFNGFSIVR
jgi:acylphosphatase